MLCIVTQFPPALPVGLFHPLMAVLLFFLRAVAKLAGLKRHWHHKGIQHEPQQGSVFNMWSDIYISKEADEKKPSSTFTISDILASLVPPHPLSLTSPVCLRFKLFQPVSLFIFNFQAFITA